jgi:hypothetical protein
MNRCSGVQSVAGMQRLVGAKMIPEKDREGGREDE